MGQFFIVFIMQILFVLRAVRVYSVTFACELLLSVTVVEFAIAKNLGVIPIFTLYHTVVPNSCFSAVGWQPLLLDRLVASVELNR
jgi:hypothetical protein